MVNSYNCPDGVSCQLFFFFFFSSRRQEGFERGTNLDARVVFQSILILFANPTQCVSGAKIEYEQYLLFGEDRRASQILANLAQTSPLFFFAIFFDLRDAENEGLVVVQSQEVILLVHLIRDAMYDLQNWNTSRWEDERGGGESGNDRLSGSI